MEKRKRTAKGKRSGALERQKNKLESVWRDVDATYLRTPLRGGVNRPFVRDSNQPPVPDGPVALLIDGIWYGLTPPFGKIWFRLTAQPQDKQWLKMVQAEIYQCFGRNRVYDQIKAILSDLVLYGSSAARIIRDNVRLVNLERLPFRDFYRRPQPIISLFWRRVSGGPFGWGPAMDALGHVKRLMWESADPGWQGDGELFRPPTTGRDLDIAAIRLKADRSAWERDGDVRRLFFSDLCGMITKGEAADVSQIARIHADALVELGPVIDQLLNDLLRPTIEVAFEAVSQSHGFPPQPPEFKKQTLKIEFLSPLAQAWAILHPISEQPASRPSEHEWKPSRLDLEMFKYYTALSGGKLGIPARERRKILSQVLQKLYEDRLLKNRLDYDSMDSRISRVRSWHKKQAPNPNLATS